MCGLVGMAGNIHDSDRKAFKWLQYFDAIRGQDSTGLAIVNPDDESITITKELGRPDYLWHQNKHFQAHTGHVKTPGKVFIGHNRAATKGKITVSNAHPFM